MPSPSHLAITTVEWNEENGVLIGRRYRQSGNYYALSKKEALSLVEGINTKMSAPAAEFVALKETPGFYHVRIDPAHKDVFKNLFIPPPGATTAPSSIAASMNPLQPD